MYSLTDPHVYKAIRKAMNNARSSANRKGIAFSLTLEWLTGLYEGQAGRCALSGLAFHDEAFPDALVKRPFSLSIDRIDPADGYTPENIQLVLVAVNFARNQWGDDVLRQISWAITEHEMKSTTRWRKQLALSISKLEREMSIAPSEQKPHLTRRLAGLKATLKKGPSRLRSAARRATKRKAET